MTGFLGYGGLFASAFLAATILPLSSELTLAALTKAGGGLDLLLLWGVASLGNTLGSCINWLLGRSFLHWRDSRWFPAKPARIERASNWFGRYGTWSLLFAWLPVVGDPLTLAAGVLKVRFLPFLLLVGFGKGLRYALVIYAAQAF